jgi:hypothetical protein
MSAAAPAAGRPRSSQPPPGSSAISASTLTRNRTNALPTGTEYAYACDGCGASFTIESPWGHIHAAIAGSLATAIAVAFLVLGEGPGWRFGGGGVLGFLALFIFAQNALRLWRRARNPVLAPTPDAPDLKAR